MEIYVVIMQRWGDYEGHSYILGVYSDYFIAKMAGKMNKLYRDGKYYARVVTLETDKETSIKLEISFCQEQEYTDKHSFEVKEFNSENKINKDSFLEETKEVEDFEILDSVGLSDQEIITLHDYLDCFSHEEKVFFRNWYLDYIQREKINS